MIIPGMKNDPSNMGVYIIRNRVTGAVYVGSSVRMSERWKSHKTRAKLGSKTRLHRSISEHGEGAFDWFVIEQCERDQLLQREKFYIDFYDSASADGLNIRENPTATYDHRVSDSTRELHRRASLGRKHSAETKALMRRSMKGIKRSESAKANMRSGRSGIVLSVFHRNNIGKSQIGRKRPADTGRKISVAKKGCRAGIALSADHRAKISAAGVGRKHSSETLEKMSASRSLYWKNKKALA